MRGATRACAAARQLTRRNESRGGDGHQPTAGASAEMLGLQGAMKTPLERCRATIAKKGAFLSSFSEVALGDGGGDLTADQYDALVLEHFFVYSAVDKIDNSILPSYDELEAEVEADIWGRGPRLPPRPPQVLYLLSVYTHFKQAKGA